MKRVCVALALLGLVALPLFAAAPPPPAGLVGAKWVWHPAIGAGGSYPGGVWYFRKPVALPAKVDVKSAELVITADNLYTFYINGALAGESTAEPNDWSKPKRFDVASLLVPGGNMLAIEAINTVAGPAGLVAKLQVTLADGKQVVVPTDGRWISRDIEEAGWEKPPFDDSAWGKAQVVAPFGGGPWRRPAIGGPLLRAGGPIGKARQATRQAIARLKEAALHPPPRRGRSTCRSSRRRPTFRGPAPSPTWARTVASIAPTTAPAAATIASPSPSSIPASPGPSPSTTCRRP